MEHIWDISGNHQAVKGDDAEVTLDPQEMGRKRRVVLAAKKTWEIRKYI